ncbi:hypothetical protein MHZ90_07685 [Pantoea sp. ACRSH]|uniref:hypothetical protein n=1 Tax=unclassified Pantoea TaxID=2630326 RepID=UPI001EF72FB0|nr:MULTISPECIES: hypothetical protein [unclassified Pantoea]MCG7366017.1 hypothetical protein [Pantoea sp. ACRSH]MCG7396645.1 hypothetical protein [Pantoea sp. ACRSC]
MQKVNTVALDVILKRLESQFGKLSSIGRPGVEKVKLQTSRFEDDAAKNMMIDRLKSILKGE